ncbi:M4 family metallopeptidase [Hymenobacter sp. IS2118]|uniref:M4 family metallopeptidase n=1 Tax=Hymenobacter sp. IS2118 TaxID=1505605 RepID=UPI000551CC5A|nr:M4 family metallopeptidase [Hymenobacter sp. IS2118]
MKKQYSAVALLLLGTLASTTAQAQDASRIQAKVVGADNQPELVQFNAAGRASYKASEGAQVLRQQLGLGSDDQMRPTRTELDQLGFTHQKFSQYYKGVKVEHANYSVHAKGGAIESISGDFEKVSGLSTTPAISEATALSRALARVGARKYMWQDAAEEAGLKQQENDRAATYLPKGELVIVRDRRISANEGALVLAWKFNVYAQEPVSRAYIYVDARTGKVVLQDNIIKHVAATGTFGTKYSGTVSSATETATGGYRLRELTRGAGIETYNARKGNSYTAAVDFIDADNNWTEYNNANFDNAALDAHYGAQSTFDYFKNVLGRNSYNNAGAKIKSYVHFDDTPGDGKGFENAYWNGSVMTYGDGATRFDPLTSLDVAAHEIGHAVCSSTANLTYANESGALNEGFSDIWGACVEYYKSPNKQTWLIGEDIDKVRPSLRSMSNPNAEGQPDTYFGTSWAPLSSSPSNANDQGGVHTNSGVLNHWFYILSVGKSGTNDIGSVYNVAAIGIDAAAKIAYRTESVYLTASSNYAAARSFSIQSATDLYGAGSAQVTAVTNAWYAVGVGAAAATTPPPTTTPTYCASKGTSQAYEWIDYVNLGTINRTSAKDAGYYNGTALSTSIAAGSAQTIRFSAGFTSTAYTENWKIYIDYNRDGDFTDAGELIVSGSSASAATLSGAFTVPATARTGATRLRVVLSDNAATTSCNTYSYGETEDYTVNITGGAAIAGGNYGLTGGDATPLGNEAARKLEVYPNPATDAVRLVLPGNAEATSVVVTDIRGVRIAGTTFSNGTLNISGLAKGMYTLSVSDGQKVFHQRFVKQ